MALLPIIMYDILHLFVGNFGEALVRSELQSRVEMNNEIKIIESLYFNFNGTVPCVLCVPLLFCTHLIFVRNK